jgi:la-related protein 6
MYKFCLCLILQVEFYFSDASITKDAFLLKHVRRNKEGFVSLKLISCFKRVKHLTKDWRQVAYAIKAASSDLEVNEQETKVRRKAPLPETDETTPSRTVVAYNLPIPAGNPNAPSVESVAEIFNKFGEIALVRILRPGNPIPGDVKQFLGKHPEIGNCVCALVEFEKTEFAKKAVAEMAQQTDNWRGVKVLELALKPKRVSF